MQPDLQPYVNAAWISAGVFWLAAAFGTKRSAQVQTSGSRLLHLALCGAAFVLLFRPGLAVGPLGWRFIPASAAVEYTGLALTIGGVAVAIWARLLLGRNWSAMVTIKEDHQIVRNGPYTVVRHPIYSGFLLAVLGTAVAIGQLRGLVALAVAFMAWWSKSRLEERFMERRFGAEYATYKQRVKAFIPFVL